MTTKQLSKNIDKYIKNDTTKSKITILIRKKNYDKLKYYNINVSQMMDDILSDLFDEMEENYTTTIPSKEDNDKVVLNDDDTTAKNVTNEQTTKGKPVFNLKTTTKK